MDPVFLALGLGAAILLFSGKKKKKDGTAPPATPDEGPPVPEGGDKPSGGGAPSGSTQAPPFPGARHSAERGHVDGSYSEWLAALGTAMDANGNSGPATMDEMRAAKVKLGIPSGRTPRSWYADQGIKSVYSMNQKIGSGPGWKPWVDAWTRMFKDFDSRPLDPTA